MMSNEHENNLPMRDKDTYPAKNQTEDLACPQSNIVQQADNDEIAVNFVQALFSL